MNPIIQKRYDKAGPHVAAALSRRNMEAFYCPTAIEGAQKVLELIAPEDVVSWGGGMTADEMIGILTVVIGLLIFAAALIIIFGSMTPPPPPPSGRNSCARRSPATRSS